METQEAGSARFRPVTDWVASVARNRPNAAAVETLRRTVTYAELWAAAHSGAHTLLRSGVSKGDIVAIATGRRIELVVAMLATSLAGGVFLLVDPNAPKERNRLILEDALPLYCVSCPDTLPDLVGLPLGRIVEISDDAVSEEALPNIEPGDLSYMMYTSGSTGRPKGALLEHGGLSNLVLAQERELPDLRAARVLQLSSVVFDASVFEIFMAICHGGTLVISEAVAGLGTFGLLRDLRTREISHVTITPSMLAALPQDDFPTLRMVMAVGEPLSQDLAERWSQGRTLINGYGPTEATAWTTAFRYQSESRRVPPIGHPIPNVEVYVVDEKGALITDGRPGELYIGGQGVGRGYHNRPEETSARYVRDLWGTVGKKYYRTGDVVTRGDDGELVFAGRADRQVKISGRRIELGEVEATLLQLPGVTAAIVIPGRSAAGMTRLWAYLCVGPREDSVKGTSANFDELLKQMLPREMCPTAYVILSEFPTTASGKVDPSKLRAPVEAEYVAGHTVPLATEV